jgi:hypothetical protein
MIRLSFNDETGKSQPLFSLVYGGWCFVKRSKGLYWVERQSGEEATAPMAEEGIRVILSRYFLEPVAFGLTVHGRVFDAHPTREAAEYWHKVLVIVQPDATIVPLFHVPLP